MQGREEIKRQNFSTIEDLSLPLSLCSSCPSHSPLLSSCWISLRGQELPQKLYWGKVSQALKLHNILGSGTDLTADFLICEQWYNTWGLNIPNLILKSWDPAFSSASQKFFSIPNLICALYTLIWVDFNSAFCSLYYPWRRMIWTRHSFVHISNPLWKDISMTNSTSICKDLKHP